MSVTTPAGAETEGYWLLEKTWLEVPAFWLPLKKELAVTAGETPKMLAWLLALRVGWLITKDLELLGNVPVDGDEPTWFGLAPLSPKIGRRAVRPESAPELTETVWLVTTPPAPPKTVPALTTDRPALFEAAKLAELC